MKDLFYIDGFFALPPPGVGLKTSSSSWCTPASVSSGMTVTMSSVAFANRKYEPGFVRPFIVTTDSSRDKIRGSRLYK
jgi:hypothetical protein